MRDFYEEKREKTYIWKSAKVGVRPHFHKHIEMVAVLKGEVDAVISGKFYRLFENDVLITFPNEVHEYTDIGETDSIVVIFDSGVLPEYRENLDNFRPQSSAIFQNRAIRDEFCRQFADNMSIEDEKIKEGVFKGHILITVGNILRSLTLLPAKNTDLSATHLVLQYCTRNFKRKLTLDELSEKLHFSKYYISRIFSGNLSTNFNTYLNDLRISFADSIIYDKTKSITEIAYESGFENIRSFNRAFKKVHGLSPNEYRISIKQG